MNLLKALLMMIAFMAATLLPATVQADETKNLCVSLTKGKRQQPTEPERQRHRTPGKGIPCILSPAGIEIQGVQTSDIYLYEICDENQTIVLTTSSMGEFLSYVLQSEEQLGIRVYTTDFVLFGWIS